MLKWEELPVCMRIPQVMEYYKILEAKRAGLILKRVIDIFLSLLLIVILALPMIVIAIVIKCTSKGPVIFKQVRVTRYAREFQIYKFRTMTINQNEDSSDITVRNDNRITKCGAFLRKYRLDEFPQLFNVLCGQMSFVGTRPEVPKYVAKYTPQMFATLLMPAGITSVASIEFKDEGSLLSSQKDVESDYIAVILPQKMRFNLEYIRKFSVFFDLRIMIKTVLDVLSKT